jgi:hypothetical protein
VDLIDRSADPVAAAREYLGEMKAGGLSAVAS